jgi:hypothetical protein
MNSVNQTRKGTTRRGFVKDVATGSAAVAAASALLGWTANASPLLQAVSQDTSDGKTKYGKCIVPIPIRKTAETVMFSLGASKLNGFPCNIIWAYGTKTGILGMSKEPHVHDHDEAIYFIGSDCKSTELGAEVNFQIGPGDGGMEDHIFSTPTVVVIPKGVWHCPMYTLKIQQPFLCMAVSLTSDYETLYWSKRKA